MARPKGSKNKKTVEREDDINDIVAPDPVVPVEDDEQEEGYVLSPGDEEDAPEVEYEDDNDPDDAPVGPPPGMRTVSQIGALGPAINQQLDARDSALIETLKSIMPLQQVPFARFKTRSSFNPSGKRRLMKRICYQNGYRCNVKTLFDEEISLIERLKPGRYIQNLVTVTLERSGDSDEDKVHIHYSNRTPDQRMTFKNHVRSFVSLLRKCVNEAEARAQARKAKRG